MAVVKRSPNRTANCDLAMDHSRGGMIHSFSERFKTRKRSVVAASSLGKWPLARTARRSLELSASMALVGYKIRRTSVGNAKNGTTSPQARRQLWPIAGYLRPQVAFLEGSERGFAGDGIHGPVDVFEGLCDRLT